MTLGQIEPLYPPNAFSLADDGSISVAGMIPGDRLLLGLGQALQRRSRKSRAVLLVVISDIEHKMVSPELAGVVGHRVLQGVPCCPDSKCSSLAGRGVRSTGGHWCSSRPVRPPEP